MDEATASLDVENETLVQEAISNLVKDKTVLIIAHRMRTVAGADQIIVLKDGCVAEQGTPEKLLEKNGIYRHMTELQNRSLSWSLWSQISYLSKNHRIACVSTESICKKTVFDGKMVSNTNKVTIT